MNAITAIFIVIILFYFFRSAINMLDPFGESTLRMSEHYIEGATGKTGSANLVTGECIDFRGYDTLGEATVLVTAYWEY
jgi:multisubunit Na+/H+ antiporter MnhB subunit